MPAFGQPPYGQPRYVAPPKPGIVPLRPLMFGEILDGSFQTIRRNATAMLGAGLLAQALGSIAAAVVTSEAGSRGENLGLWLESLRPAELAGLGLGVLAAFLVLSAVSVFISMVLQGAMAVPVARSVLNRRTGFRQMWTLSRSKVGALVGLGALLLLAVIGAGAVLVGGAVLLANTMGGSSALIIVPLFLGAVVSMVWISIRLVVAPAAVVVEELGALEGLRRSWHLTRNNWWRIFGISLVVSLMIGIIGQIVLIPVSLATGGVAGVVSPHGGDGQAQSMAISVGIASIIISGLVAAAGYAFQTSVVSLLYIDLRMRKEGLDLSLLRLLESGADDGGVPGRGLAPPRDTGNARTGGWPPAPYGTPPGPG